MKEFIMYSGFDNQKNYRVVKNVYKFSEFEDVISVFKQPPYNEVLSKSDCEEEYNLYMNNGIIIGVYVNENLAGINCILNDVPENYSIKFKHKEQVAYYSGLAVKNEYRKLGLGKLLVSKTEEYIAKSNIYDFSFARILCQGSMSERIFKINNFVDAYCDNELIVDEVEYLRNTGSIMKDKRKYMVKAIKNSNNFYYKR